MPTLVPFARARQESLIKPANCRSDAGAHTRRPITISQREMLTISPDVTAHVSHDTKKRGQQQVHTVQGGITSPTTNIDTATDNYSYQVVSLRFKEAREPKQPFGIGKTLTLQRAARRTQGAMRRCPRRRFAHTLSFADSSSLADRFLADSAPPGVPHACTSQHRSSLIRDLPRRRELRGPPARYQRCQPLLNF
jgi:hypothetical protein